MVGLPSPAQALIGLRAEVAGCVKQGELWSYSVSITAGNVHYALPRRYSAFRELHSRIKALGVPAPRVPRFPPKRAYATQDEPFAARRREELHISHVSPYISPMSPLYLP